MPTSEVWEAIDLAHTALRKVDASDTAAPQTDATLAAISNAITVLERLAHDAGHVLPEWHACKRKDRR